MKSKQTQCYGKRKEDQPKEKKQQQKIKVIFYPPVANAQNKLKMIAIFIVTVVFMITIRAKLIFQNYGPCIIRFISCAVG